MDRVQTRTDQLSWACKRRRVYLHRQRQFRRGFTDHAAGPASNCSPVGYYYDAVGNILWDNGNLLAILKPQGHTAHPSERIYQRCGSTHAVNEPGTG
jgi:hypothetical protein